jgi:hypothetical protein
VAMTGGVTMTALSTIWWSWLRSKRNWWSRSWILRFSSFVLPMTHATMWIVNSSHVASVACASLLPISIVHCPCSLPRPPSWTAPEKMQSIGRLHLSVFTLEWCTQLVFTASAPAGISSGPLNDDTTSFPTRSYLYL